MKFGFGAFEWSKKPLFCPLFDFCFLLKIKFQFRNQNQHQINTLIQFSIQGTLVSIFGLIKPSPFEGWDFIFKSESMMHKACARIFPFRNAIAEQFWLLVRYQKILKFMDPQPSLYGGKILNPPKNRTFLSVMENKWYKK